MVVRKPPPLARPLDTLSVTSFRSYLACPYRFYLRHVLKLSVLDDEAEELGPDTFGTLIHDVLKDFGKSALRDSRDSGVIEEFLDRCLTERVHARFAGEQLPAITVQINQARRGWPRSPRVKRPGRPTAGRSSTRSTAADRPRRRCGSIKRHR